MKSEQIPQKLDNPAQVFWLEVDEIMPFFICWAAGLFLRKLTGSTWMVTGGIAVGIFFSWVYMKHSSTTQTLTEEFFGDKDVAAVTIYPNLSLQPNQSTDVLIMTKRGGN